jgi:beta-aspartyl-peptidase (threonine type)
LILLTLIVAPLVNGKAQGTNTDPKQEIQVILDKQIVAWNRGDLEGFMGGYWKSPDLVYLSNQTVVRGWQTLLDRYRQLYQPPNEGKMGALSLPEEEITILGQDSAIVWGTFIVKTSDGKTRGGLYTLAMHKLPEGWRTVYDRTSVEQLP